MTTYVAKRKALITCAVTVQLICVFVFAYAKIRFSHDVAHLLQEFVKVLMYGALANSNNSEVEKIGRC